MEADIEFIDPIETAADYLLQVGERWTCPCGGGFWQQVDSMSAYCSSRVWCPHCGTSAAWVCEVTS